MIKKTIAIVDDNPNNLNVLFKLFEKTDYEVAFFRDALSFLETIGKNNPDLILLDILMPEMDGFELISKLKEDKKTEDIPVIFMSALDDIDSKVKGLECGGVDYITKPIQPTEVLARVKTHLRLSDALKQLEKANEELGDKNEKLAELNATKDRFFSIISHDLVNPFSSLRGNAELVLDYFDDRSAEDFKRMVTSISEVLLHVVDLSLNLLSWAKIQQKGISYNPKKIDLHQIATELVQFFKQNAADKNIEITNEVNKNMIVETDKEVVFTILRNLTSNAIKFTPRNGKINISATEKNKHLEVSVADNGVGIAKEDTNKLFRIDKQLKTKGTEKEAGTGLGLILCKEFVNKLKGNIWVESEKGKGSKFTFTINR